MDYFSKNETNLKNKITNLNWPIIFLIMTLGAIGLLMLYSAGHGKMDPWMIRQLKFYIAFLPIMFFIALIDIKIWYKLAYPMYLFGIILLLLVAVVGHNALGATRWIRFGGINNE